MKQALLTKEFVIAKRPLSKSWSRAAGLLRQKKTALTRHINQVRKEWVESR